MLRGNSNNDLLFISIAAYRDEQLIPTVIDCLAKARHPSRLRFGICWQHGPEERLLPFAQDPRFQIMDIHFMESKGVCWARSAILKLWRGERWFLQIDSHCRFAAGFDETLINDAILTNSPKPIISSYPPAFTPTGKSEYEAPCDIPQIIAVSKFSPNGIPYLRPVPFSAWQTHHAPIRARFVSAGSLFTVGSFVDEVGYDPSLYFFGEEIVLAVRAFSHGYDLFHPHQVVMWHDYSRSYLQQARRHWHDHHYSLKQEHLETVGPHSGNPLELSNPKHRNLHDIASQAKISALLQAAEDSGEAETYGLGNVRSLNDYENYAGLSFRDRKIQGYTQRSLEPPNPLPSPTWKSEVRSCLVRLVLDPRRLPPSAFVDPAIWCVAIKDDDGNEIHRHDFSGEDLLPFSGKEGQIALVVEFESSIAPASWTIRPVSKLGGWLRKTSGILYTGDYVWREPK